MRKLVLIFLSGFFASALAQDKPPAQPPQQLDKDTQTRIRTERSAGGLGNITPEEKANANVGAGPHMQTKPEGAAKREPVEGESERAAEQPAGRGASR